MSLSTITSRQWQTYAGGAIVLAAAHVTILKTGGYLTAHAPLVITLAAGVIAAARAIGEGSLTRGLAIGIGIALAAGEGYNLMATFDRMIEAREETQAPTRALHKKREEAVSALAKLEAGKPSTERLTMAQAELAAARSGDEPASVKAARTAVENATGEVRKEAANVACKTLCNIAKDDQRRAEQALRDAIRDAEQASGNRIAKAEAAVQAALTEAVAKHTADVDAAKQRVADTPEPKSATPAADRLNLEPATWDLMLAIVLSVGANGLAALLLAAGASPLPAGSTSQAAGSAQAESPATNRNPEPAMQDSLQTSFPSSTSGVTAAEFLKARQGSGSTSQVEPVPPTSPNGSGPKGGTRKARSEPQRRADLIAKELRDRGETPKFHIVRSEYRARFGTELPKVTAHRAVS